jgi:hypothetical protein
VELNRSVHREDLNMKKAVKLLCAACICVHPPVAPQATPRACQDTGQLGAQEKGVVHHLGRFTRAGRPDHPVETFSTGQKKNKNEANMCFRYEIDNREDQTLESFRWPDINVWWMDIKPKARSVVRRDMPTKYEEPDAIASDMFAFAGAKDRSEAHFTIEQTAQRKVGVKQIASSLEFYRLSESVPSAVSFLTQNGFRIDPIAAYPGPVGATKFPDIRTSLLLAGMKFTALSSATFDGKEFSTETVVSMEGAETVTIQSPGLLALEKAPVASVDDEKAIRDLVPLLRSFAAFPPTSQRAYKRSFSVVQPANAKKPVLFVSQFPVAIKTPNSSFCIGINAYAPLPFSIEDEYCGKR